MSEDVKAKDVVLTLVYIALGILVITAAVWLFYPGGSQGLHFLEVYEIEEDMEVIRMTDEIFAEYPMLEGPPSGIGIRGTAFSQIFGIGKKINPSTAAEIQEKFGSAYLDYDGKYYVIARWVS